jgi:hypothetical protein
LAKNQTQKSLPTPVNMPYAGNYRRGAGRRRGNRNRQTDGQQNQRTRLPNQLILKPSYTAPYKFSRSFDLGNLVKSASDQGYAWPFALNQVPNSQEFTSLFDKYRIVSIDLTFSYWRDGGSSNFTQDLIWPAMHLFMDDDDAIIPTTKSEVMERMSVQRVSFSPMRQTISVKIRPRWVQSRGGTSTNIAPVNTWIDMSTPGVQHYGVKAWVDHYDSTATSTQISAAGVMHFECNSVR